MKFCQSIILFIVSFCFYTASCVKAVKSASSTSAAVPRSKQSKGALGFLQSSLIDRFLREVKISFSSELESLALQITRPTNQIVPISNLDMLISFLDVEYENPELVVGLLAKLSRKFAEKNIFTKLKAIFSTHYIYSNAQQEKARLAFLKATLSMCEEMDEKTEDVFFSLDSLDNSLIQANTAEELAYIELTRLYTQHIFHYFSQRNLDKKTSTSVEEKVEGYLTVLDNVQQVEEFITKNDILNKKSLILASQVQDMLVKDKDHTNKMLLKYYNEEERLEKETVEALEKALKKLNAEFKPSSPSQTSDKVSEESEEKAKEMKDEVLPVSVKSSIMKSIDKLSVSQGVKKEKSIEKSAESSAVQSGEKKAKAKKISAEKKGKKVGKGKKADKSSKEKM